MKVDESVGHWNGTRQQLVSESIESLNFLSRCEHLHLMALARIWWMLSPSFFKSTVVVIILAWQVAGLPFSRG
jgi:hypothetical protein